MSAIPFFQFYPADYLADTTHLSTEQHGAYLLLLMAAWSSGGRLPNDKKKLARIARVTARRWHLIEEDVMPFFVEEGSEIVSVRMERDHQKAVSKSAARSASGSLGGKAKALKDKERDLANATCPPCHSSEPDPDIGTEVPIERGATAPAPEKPKRKPPKRACQLPDDWHPQAQANAPMAMIGMTSQEIAAETDKFRDHAKANGRTAKDWDAAYRNWVRKALEFRATRRPAQAQQAEHPNATRTRTAIEELAYEQGLFDHAPEQPGRLIGGRSDDESRTACEWPRPEIAGPGSAEIIDLYGT